MLSGQFAGLFSLPRFHRNCLALSISRYLRPSFCSMTSNHPGCWIDKYDGLTSWTEDLGRYETGVYYPVHIGDLLGAGRYKVLHKLGNGTFAQVWLAKDHLPG